jgi:hypothetical protein
MPVAAPLAPEMVARDGPPPTGRVEERPERLEERRVVQQLVYSCQLGRHDQGLLGQHRLPQTGPGAVGSEHDGSNSLLRQGVWAIIAAFGAGLVDPSAENALVKAGFQPEIFTGK